MSTQDLDKDLVAAALEYHRHPTPGKISVVPTKPLANQRDLALAYSPGVAAACEEIVADPAEAAALTARGNLVAVITNGTAVLGLGNIGPLAAKPVMEGKALLFKKFAGIDVFDIELAESDPDKLIDAIARARAHASAASTWKTSRRPSASTSSSKLRERMNIPVFHDDQHGTAIISAAALLNGLSSSARRSRIKLVCTGAGAAAIACLDLMVRLGAAARERLRLRQQGRDLRRPRPTIEPYKARYAQATDARTLADVDRRARTCSSAVRPPAC